MDRTVLEVLRDDCMDVVARYSENLRGAAERKDYGAMRTLFNFIHEQMKRLAAFERRLKQDGTHDA